MRNRIVKVPFLRNAQSGQALVILALGFIALVGFVGIVTDVSLLLVRYSTLSRAVDSAAIAAAGQYRTDRTYAEMSLAARQMIQLHGLEPEDVIVETCETTIPLDASGNVDGEGDKFLCEDNRNRKLVRVGAEVLSPTVFMRVLGFQDFMISAVSISETAALDIVMVLDVSDSMLSDTTYAQWADVGLGKVYIPPRWRKILYAEKAANRFTTNPAPTYGVITPDPTLMFDDTLQLWNNLLREPQEIINRRLSYDNNTSPNPYVASANLSYPVTSFTYPGAVGTQNHPRVECRVRFWPYSDSVLVPDHLKNMTEFWTRWYKNPLPLLDGVPAETGANYEVWQGFVPAYDFYGCCNDPTSGGRIVDLGNGDYEIEAIPGETLDITQSDFNFSDLICEPFRQARNATREFLTRVDFDRGDRVAFVTFDKSATIIDPDGSIGFDDSIFDGNTHWCQTAEGEDVDASGRTTFTHMINDAVCAEETLIRTVGVRTEDNWYGWKEDGGGWTYFANGLEEGTGRSLEIDYYTIDANDTQLANNDYPVRGNCSFQNAFLDFYQSLYSLWNWNLAEPSGTYEPQLRRTGFPNKDDVGWSDIDPNGLNSYELQADCRNANFGSALREANNALLDPDTTRREGTVWVMVFLSDGAAGASDPVRRAGFKPNRARPYYDRSVLNEPYEDWGGYSALVRFGKSSAEQSPGIQYGWFGLCPIGTPGLRGQLTRTDRLVEFPFCSDEEPQTRHFCTPPNKDEENVGKNCADEAASVYSHGFAPGSRDRNYDCTKTLEENLAMGNIYDVDVGFVGTESEDTCSLYYDVDDYARDWADYVGLSKSGAAEQLPTIFTIGFGIHYRSGSPTPNLDPSDPNYIPGPAIDNVPDHLGEELLRYIADVGDNSRIDTDYQQDYLDDREKDLDGFLTNGSFGLRGPCEDPNVKPDVGGTVYSNTTAMIAPLPPRQDCGNYFNAPDEARLQLVFDEIASRMFTRLAP